MNLSWSVENSYIDAINSVVVPERFIVYCELIPDEMRDYFQEVYNYKDHIKCYRTFASIHNRNFGVSLAETGFIPKSDCYVVMTKKALLSFMPEIRDRINHINRLNGVASYKLNNIRGIPFKRIHTIIDACSGGLWVGIDGWYNSPSLTNNDIELQAIWYFSHLVLS